MSLNGIINTGKSAVLAQQAAIATASQNTANVNTPGYHKRDVHFRPQGFGMGLQAETMRRRTDSYLGARILDANAQQAAAEYSATTLAAVDQIFAPGEGNMGSALDDFFNALRAMEGAPADLDSRRAVIGSAKALSEAVSGAALRLNEEQRRADQAVDGLLIRVNSLTESIAALNARYRQVAATGQGVDELRDQREVLIDELSTYIDITTFEGSTGEVNVLFNGGQPLVQDLHSAQLRAVPDAGLGNFKRVDLVNTSGVAFDITADLEGGKLGGLITLRDDQLAGVVDRVDQLAYDIQTAFNATHTANYGLDGVNGRNFFDPPAQVEDAARGMRLAAGLESNPDWIAASTSIAEAIGGNAGISALIDLEDQPLAFGGTRTFGEELADMTGEVGQLVRGNLDDMERSGIELDSLRAIESSQTGISLDEELVDMMRFQQAYQAGAKVLETARMMFDTLLQLGG